MNEEIETQPNTDPIANRKTFDWVPPAKTGPRPGSRPWLLANMKPGERLFFESPPGKVASVQSNIGVDIRRVGYQGFIVMSTVIGVEIATRGVIDLVMCTRRAMPDEKDESIRSISL